MKDRPRSINRTLFPKSQIFSQQTGPLTQVGGPVLRLQNSVFDLKSATGASQLNSLKSEDWFHRPMGSVLLSNSL